MKNIARKLALQLIDPDAVATEEYVDTDPEALVEEKEEGLHVVITTYAKQDHTKYNTLNNAIYSLVNAHAEKAYENGIRAGAQLMMSLLANPNGNFKDAIAQLMKEGI